LIYAAEQVTIGPDMPAATALFVAIERPPVFLPIYSRITPDDGASRSCEER